MYLGGRINASDEGHYRDFVGNKQYMSMKRLEAALDDTFIAD